MVDVALIRRKYEALRSSLDERSRRLWAATEARAAGRGGFTAVLQATGLSRKTVARGLQELDSKESLPQGRVRRRGGGRKPATSLDPELTNALTRRQLTKTEWSLSPTPSMSKPKPSPTLPGLASGRSLAATPTATLNR